MCRYFYLIDSLHSILHNRSSALGTSSKPDWRDALLTALRLDIPGWLDELDTLCENLEDVELVGSLGDMENVLGVGGLVRERGYSDLEDLAKKLLVG